MNSLLYLLLCVFFVRSPEEPPTTVTDEFETDPGIDFKTCPPMEHRSKCNAHCQKNCTNFDQPIICPDICIEGCVCGRGLVRARNGLCVPPRQCPGEDRCPRGEHFDQCNGRCQKTCSNWNKPDICPAVCIKGCICDEGSVRGPDGRCITTEECPKKEDSGAESIKTTSDVHDIYWFCEEGQVRGPSGQCQSPETISITEEIDESTAYNSGGCPDQDKCDANCKTKHLNGICVGLFICVCLP